METAAPARKARRTRADRHPKFLRNIDTSPRAILFVIFSLRVDSA
jgi:hypothetical protein